jgi:hypothetical protein
MAKVLTTGSSLACPHGGNVTWQGTGKLTVVHKEVDKEVDKEVVLAGGISFDAAKDCPSPDSNTKCTGAVPAGGASSKLTIGEPAKAVLLDGMVVTFATTTIPNVKQPSANQQRLTAD